MTTYDIGKYWTEKNAIAVPQCYSNSGLYAIGISALNPTENPGRITKELKEHVKKYDMTGIDMNSFLNTYVDPKDKEKRRMKLCKAGQEISKFEKQNPEFKILLLCAATDKKSYSRLHDTKSPNTILIIFINPEGRCHWSCVRDFNRLSYRRRQGLTSYKAKLHCFNCHSYSTNSEEKLKFHKELCENNLSQMCTTPGPGEVCKFKKFKNMMMVPVVIYADFECYQKGAHTPSGFGMYIKSIDDDIYHSRYISETFDGDVALKFLKCVLAIRDELDDIPDREMEMTEQEKSDYAQSNTCWICSEKTNEFPEYKIVEKKQKDGTTTKVEKLDNSLCKVKDHCHFTGKFRGPAHSKCNLKLRKQRFIPVFFHNLSGYDSHLLVKSFSKLKETPYCIPENTEKFIMMSLTRPKHSAVKFLDSFRFKGRSLDKLVSELSDCPILRSDPTLGKHFEIFRRKGVFPYEWFDSYEKLSATKFPDHEAFRSRLSGVEVVKVDGKKVTLGKKISKDEYEYAKTVYKKFCENMKDYHDLYMRCDVLLLADVMENFRCEAYDAFQLDPLNYVTDASYAWDCLLKFSKVELEVLSDYNMYLFFEAAKRGGYSNCHKNYSEANHKYLPNFNPNEPSKFLAYFDINSQYPSVMINPMPVRDFRWAFDFEIEDIFELCVQKKHHEIASCIIQCDLKHDVKNIEREKIFAMCPVIFGGKLCHTLYDKEKYIVHHRAFKSYLDYGMIVTKIHTAIFFDEEPWARDYINFCVEKRKKATKDGIESQVQFWKNMMNKPYGKTMEDVRNRIDFRLVNKKKKLLKLINQPSFVYEKEYVDNGGDDILYGVQMKEPNIVVDKPIYTGQCILDDSKILMYNFVYDYCMKKWPDGRFKICQTDTDSVIVEIQTDDLMFDIKDDIEEWFDTSSFLRTEFDGTEIPKMNSKVLGKLKDELGGQFMIIFVGVGPKNYSYMYMKLDGTEDTSSVCKGVPKCVHPEFKEYQDLILKGKDKDDIYKECTRISSKSHCVKTEKITKVALTKELRKRERDVNDEYETVPYGYYGLLSENE